MDLFRLALRNGSTLSIVTHKVGFVGDNISMVIDNGLSPLLLLMSVI